MLQKITYTIRNNRYSKLIRGSRETTSLDTNKTNKVNSIIPRTKGAMPSNRLFLGKTNKDGSIIPRTDGTLPSKTLSPGKIPGGTVTDLH